MDSRKGYNGMDEIEEIKSSKEIEDIITERNKIQQLLSESKWDKLDTYLKKLNIKYGAETFIYNLVNPIMPQNIPENAQNCIRFLNFLLEEKAIDADNRSSTSNKQN